MLKRIENGLEKFISILISAVLIVMITVVFAQVILRYVFNSGAAAFEELARYLFVWTSFLGIALGVKRKSHMSIDFLSSKFPRARPFFTVCYYVTHFAFFLIILYFGWVYTLSVSTAVSALLPIKMSLVYGAVPACAGFSLIFVILQLASELRGHGRKAEVR